MGCFYPKPDPRASAYSIAQPSQQNVSDLRNNQGTSDLWEDLSFPPNDLSIFGKSPDQKTKKQLERFKGAGWVSIFHLYELFVDKTEYKDAVQTFLGDCFFVAVVSSLAEKKGRISALFPTKGSSKGEYEVAYYYMGKREVVKLDSYFPFIADEDDQKKKVTLAGTNGKESWVLFLEKAFAKVFGSYAAIFAGDPMEAMRFLTGAPAAKIMTAKITESEESKDGIWNMLVGKNSEYLFTCGTGEESDKLKKKRLTPDHSYTIISAFKTHSGERLLFIRNPWGHIDKDGNGEWVGKWSDQDLKKHIEKLKEMPYEYKGEDDGLFHISYKDFLKYFESMEVCYLEQEFVLRSSERIISKTNETKNFQFTVEGRSETSFFIMVNQESERKFSKHSGYQNFEYSAITFNVFDSKKKKMLEDNVSGESAQVGTGITLAPGNYDIAVTIRWSDFATSKRINHFVLNLYGPRNVK